MTFRERVADAGVVPRETVDQEQTGRLVREGVEPTGAVQDGRYDWRAAHS